MKRILVAIMLVLGMTIVPAVQAFAQPVATESVFQLESFEGEIDLGPSGDLTYVPDSYSFSGSGQFREEFIFVDSQWSTYELILVTGPTTAEEYHDLTLGNMEVFYTEFELIEETVLTDSSWWIARADYEGTPLYIYFEYVEDAYDDIDFGFMQFTYADSFVADMELVQDEVTIAGSPILTETDATEIATLIDGDLFTTGTTTTDTEQVSTPETGTTTNTSERTDRTSRTTTAETETPEVTTGTTRTTRTTTTETETPEVSTGTTTRGTRSSLGDETPIATEEVVDPAADWEELGLVSDSEWVSPSYGIAVAWDTANWEFPLDYESAIYINADPVYDVLTLQTVDGLGYVFINVEDAGDLQPITLANWWNSEEYAASFQTEVTIIEIATTSNTASVVYSTENTIGQPLFVVLEATFLDSGEIIYSRVSAAPESVADVYEQYSAGVTVEGQPLDLTWTPEEIDEFAGN